MRVIIVCLLSISFAIAAVHVVCNGKPLVVDDGDPNAMRLAQLQLLQCMLDSQNQLNTGIIDIVKSQQPSLFQYILSLITELTIGFLVFRVVLQTFWFCLIYYNIRAAQAMFEIEAMRHKMLGSRNPHLTVHDMIQEMKPPLPVKVFWWVSRRPATPVEV